MWPVQKQIHWEMRQNVNEGRDMMQNVNKSRDMILRFKKKKERYMFQGIQYAVI